MLRIVRAIVRVCLRIIKNVQPEIEMEKERERRRERARWTRAKTKREEKIGSLHSIALYLHFMKINQYGYKTPMRYNSIIL